MKIDLKKLLNNDATITLQWHGDDTKVLVRGDATKTVVEKGGTLKVSVAQAQELIRYSYLWTLEGEEPADNAFDKIALPFALKKAEAELKAREKSQSKSKKDDAGNNSPDDIDFDTLVPETMKKVDITAALTALGVSFNDTAKTKSLAGLLSEALKERAEKLAEAEANTNPDANVTTPEAGTDEKKAEAELKEVK